MNFLKYSGKTAEAIKIRNIIAQLNCKLAKQIKKYDEEILSDAYLDILNAVEYFDYRLGNKFSTYATWVLKRIISEI
jgi:DNA-directed RNA polymerase specialized sigma subunit